MNDRFLALQLFVRVARSGSFSAVARETGYSQPSVSRIVHDLEKSIGASLLTRTTRAVTLTEVGSEYLARAESILSELEEADHAARGTGELRGLLRVAMSSSMASRIVLPRLARFTKPHPALRVEFILTDERQDLVTGAIDIAIRVGALADSIGAVARRLGAVQRVVVASPDYLQAAGVPKQPTDLRSHALIVGPSARTLEAWKFDRDGKSFSIRTEGNLVINGNEAVISAAVAGLGIASSGILAFRRELEQGTLVRVLPDWRMGSAEVNAILPAGRSSKPSARAFAQFMSTEFQDLLEDNTGPNRP
ncbi:LysR family transcriptional regulator [Robbsia sp. KACC 23696]|uniref:LysR family transcriptional regulator n=1 Tax=Robbsia sp. KACC 23696 TaxID=3149231 RepID=UPI00325C13EB